MRRVLQVLVLGVGVDRRHQALDDAELVIEHLGHRAEAVRGARRVGDDVLAAVVLVVVDAHHDGDVLVGGRGGDDDLLGAGIEVALSLGARGEDTGGLDDDVHAQIAPRDGRRALLDREGLDLLVADDDRVVTLEADVLGQAAQDGVELQQVGQRGVVGEVVDRDDLDVGGTEGLLGLHGTEEVAADAAESVDAYANSHVLFSLSGRRARIASRATVVGDAAPIRSQPRRCAFVRRRSVRLHRPRQGRGATRRRASRWSRLIRCRESPRHGPSCPPSRAVGGSVRPRRPSSSAGRRVCRVPPETPGGA